MDFYTVPNGRDVAQFRLEMTTKYRARVLDMMRLRWVCPRCNTDVPSEPLIVPEVGYRTLDEALAFFTRVLDEVAQAPMKMGGVAGQELAVAIHMPPGRPMACGACGSGPSLVSADVALFNTQLADDLVLRIASSAAPQLFARGALITPTPELHAGFSRDALVRAFAVAREADDVVAGVALMQEAARVAPGDPDLLSFLPWLNNNRATDAVVAMADATMQRFPDRADGPFWKAQVLIQAGGETGNPALAEQAAPLLERALAIDPGHADAAVALANLARVRGRDEEAASILRRLLASKPDHGVANFTLGLIVLAANPAEALACFERGERSDPNDPDYPRGRAMALARLGRKPEAQAAIMRAQQLAPNDPKVHRVMSELAGNPIATAITWGVRILVGSVLIGVVLFVLKILRDAGVFGAP